jgi:Protein of unknown function (DUF1275)
MAIVSDRGIGNKALGLAWLSFASGCTDVLSFLELGDVFTSAMIGNTALLARGMHGYADEARPLTGFRHQDVPPLVPRFHPRDRWKSNLRSEPNRRCG